MINASSRKTWGEWMVCAVCFHYSNSILRHVRNERRIEIKFKCVGNFYIMNTEKNHLFIIFFLFSCIFIVGGLRSDTHTHTPRTKQSRLAERKQNKIHFNIAENKSEKEIESRATMSLDKGTAGSLISCAHGRLFVSRQNDSEDGWTASNEKEEKTRRYLSA